MNFYEYTQNNTGGSWVQNKDLTHRVFIEARTAEKSKEIAFKIGIYFDGVADGLDCACCGDRWSEPSELVFPYRYGTLSKQRALEASEKYDADFGKTTFRFPGVEEPDPNGYDVVFRNVESYARYLKDNYGMFGEKKGHDAIIYYANGKKKLI